MPTDTSSPDRIERDLAETRARMGANLNQLQDRLSPGQVIDDAMAYFRGSDGADFGRNLLASVRENPLPAALTGIGLAWLMTVNREPQGSGADTSDDGFDARLRGIDQQVIRRADESEHSYTARVHEARGRFVGVSRDAHDTDETFSERVQSGVARARQAAADTAANLRDKAGDAVSGTASAFSTAAGNAMDRVNAAAGSASEMAQSAASRAGGTLRSGSRAAGRVGSGAASTVLDNPMLLGVLGLAAGALLGSLLPQAEGEEELLGGVAGQARDKAQELAAAAKEQGATVAQSVLDAGKESAGRSGLTDGSVGDAVDAALSGDLAASAKQVAQDALKAGEDATRAQVQPGTRQTNG